MRPQENELSEAGRSGIPFTSSVPGDSLIPRSTTSSLKTRLSSRGSIIPASVAEASASIRKNDRNILIALLF
jgi:hypothetical protein